MSYRSGYVSIVGRPNVGKSTLLNYIIGQKVAIVSPKAQTTRNSIRGIKTYSDAQIIFIDTPGIHKPGHELGHSMVRDALASIAEVDVVILMVSPEMPKNDDIKYIKDVIDRNNDCILVINKADTVKHGSLLPIMQKYSEAFSFAEIVPISAKTGEGVDDLIAAIKRYIPEGPQLYPDDITSDQLERFLVSEIIREKIMILTMDEVPHSVAVEVLKWDEKRSGKMIRVEANIYVERESQKGIIIGKAGVMLKRIGSMARKEIEDLFGSRFYLSLWVKVKKDWRDNPEFLKDIGFDNAR
ncbi:MAG: GTPase Era [Nitrospirota bacterium]|nr:MAG: GTPase Era [Nitrospirota bacterium]